MTKVTPHNAFTPAKEVQDIDRFAGRSELLDGLSGALQSDGAQIVIYGERGIGKSSLSRVLSQLAINRKEAIERLTQKPHRRFDYLPIFVSCDDSVSNVDRLCLRLLTDTDALASWVPFRVVERKNTGSVAGKLSIKVLELSGSSADAMTERADEVESDVRSTFVSACKSVVQSGVAKDGLLIIVDEFDRVADKAGLASLLKSLGSESVTFALVGVAETLGELIADHESVARQLADGVIRVTPMPRSDLREIIARAMAALGGGYKFEDRAIDWIAGVARGHPFYVHLVGKHALLGAITRRSKKVEVEDAKQALSEIAFKGAAPVQEATYKKAVGHSYVREVILKRFAASDEQEVYTTHIYKGLANDLGIEPGAISVYVGQLTSDKYGAVMRKTRERYYQFADSLFKAYAAARPYERKQGDREEEG